MKKLIHRFINVCINMNITKTLYFNFKMFPIRIALRCPVVFYGKTTFRHLSGKIVINPDVPIKRGLVKIGVKHRYVDNTIPENILILYGSIVVNGPVDTGRGTYICVAKSGALTLGDKDQCVPLWMGTHIRIICFDRITIKCARITWDCQIYDTNFHYIENEDGEVLPLTAPIFIDNEVWIGNRTTISKGAVIPRYAIVASNSLVNKDFSLIQNGCLLAGIPATLKKQGLKRVYDAKREAAYDEKFYYERILI